MTTPTRPYAFQVSRQLADAGHQRAKWDRGEWTPGFVATQSGDRVAVSCEGPLGRVHPDVEARQLAEYALALTNLGYRVETAAREMDTGETGRGMLVVRR